MSDSSVDTLSKTVVFLRIREPFILLQKTTSFGVSKIPQFERRLLAPGDLNVSR